MRNKSSRIFFTLPLIESRRAMAWRSVASSISGSGNEDSDPRATTRYKTIKMKG
jgi:hypothetical protein